MISATMFTAVVAVTMTGSVATTPSQLTLIVAGPADWPVSRPSGDTVTTAFAELVKVVGRASSKTP